MNIEIVNLILYGILVLTAMLFCGRKSSIGKSLLAGFITIINWRLLNNYYCLSLNYAIPTLIISTFVYITSQFDKYPNITSKSITSELNDQEKRIISMCNQTLRNYRVKHKKS